VVFVLHAGVVAWVEKDGAAAVRVASPNTKFVLCDRLAHPDYHFGRLRHSMLNYFNSSRVGLKLVLYMMTNRSPVLKMRMSLGTVIFVSVYCSPT